MSNIINLSDKEFYVAVFGELPTCDLEETDAQALFNILGTLTPREASIIARYYGLGSIKQYLDMDVSDQLGTVKESMSQIAKDYGISAGRIKQVRDKALRKLRHPFRTEKMLELYRSRSELRAQVLELEEKVGTLKNEVLTLNAELDRVRAQYNELVNRPTDDDPVMATEEAPRSWKLEHLGFSARTYNGLKRVGVASLGDITMLSRYEATKLRNIGQKSFDEIEAKLESFGLHFRSDD